MTPLQWFFTIFSGWSCFCVLVAFWLYYCRRGAR